jgi:hypothetical protein
LVALSLLFSSSCDATRQDVKTGMANDRAAFHNAWMACLQRNTVEYGGIRLEYGGIWPEYGGIWPEYGGIWPEYGWNMVKYGWNMAD